MRKNTKADMGKLYDVISSSVEKTVSSAITGRKFVFMHILNCGKNSKGA